MTSECQSDEAGGEALEIQVVVLAAGGGGGILTRSRININCKQSKSNSNDMTCQSAAPECQPSCSHGQIAGDCSIKALTTRVQAIAIGSGEGWGEVGVAAALAQ